MDGYSIAYELTLLQSAHISVIPFKKIKNVIFAFENIKIKRIKHLNLLVKSSTLIIKYKVLNPTTESSSRPVNTALTHTC